MGCGSELRTDRQDLRPEPCGDPTPGGTVQHRLAERGIRADQPLLSHCSVTAAGALSEDGHEQPGAADASGPRPIAAGPTTDQLRELNEGDRYAAGAACRRASAATPTPPTEVARGACLYAFVAAPQAGQVSLTGHPAPITRQGVNNIPRKMLVEPGPRPRRGWFAASKG